MKLGERLIGLSLISREQLADGLRTQSLHGARLGTHLVQAGAIDLDALTHVLGAHLAVPVATAVELEAVEESLVARLPAALAEQHLAVPVSLLASGTLVLAMVDPTDLVALVDLEQQLGVRVRPVVAPELRIRYWLERHYGIARDNRFLRGLIGGAIADERRRYIAPTPALQVESTPVAGQLARIIPVRRTAPVASPPPPADDDLDLQITVDVRRRSSEALRAIDVIGDATSGEIIADAVIDYLSGRAEAGLLLRIHGEFALGWRASPPMSAEAAALITVPLELPTALRTVVENGRTFRGQPAEDQRVWHDRLSSILGQGSPREVLVVPVLGAGMVRALIYSHTCERPLDEAVVADVEAIGAAISAALDKVAKGS